MQWSCLSESHATACLISKCCLPQLKENIFVWYRFLEKSHNVNMFSQWNKNNDVKIIILSNIPNHIGISVQIMVVWYFFQDCATIIQTYYGKIHKVTLLSKSSLESAIALLETECSMEEKTHRDTKVVLNAKKLKKCHDRTTPNKNKCHSQSNWFARLRDSLSKTPARATAGDETAVLVSSH